VQEDISIHRDVYTVNPNCDFVLKSNIFRLIQLLENSGLTANQQDALDSWLNAYTEMLCYDQLTTDCTIVLQNIVRLIQRLESSPVPLPSNVQEALNTWIIVYSKMKCFDQTIQNCNFVLNSNIFRLIQLMETTGGLSTNQEEALFYWTGIYELMKCAGCGCTGGCTGVCPVCHC